MTTTSSSTSTSRTRRHVVHLFSADSADKSRAIGLRKVRAYCGRWVRLSDDPHDSEDHCRSCTRAMATQARQNTTPDDSRTRRKVTHIYNVWNAEAARAMGVLEVRAFCGRWIDIDDDPQTDLEDLAAAFDHEHKVTTLMLEDQDCGNCTRAMRAQARRYGHRIEGS